MSLDECDLEDQQRNMVWGPCRSLVRSILPAPHTTFDTPLAAWQGH